MAKDFRITPTGNPLTEDQVEEWRKFLLNEVGRAFGHSSPVGANVLCDMAQAAVRLAQRPEEQPTAWIVTSERGGVLHISQADGWKVEAVTTEPPPMAFGSMSQQREPTFDTFGGTICTYCGKDAHDGPCMNNSLPSEG